MSKLKRRRTDLEGEKGELQYQALAMSQCQGQSFPISVLFYKPRKYMESPPPDSLSMQLSSKCTSSLSFTFMKLTSQQLKHKLNESFLDNIKFSEFTNLFLVNFSYISNPATSLIHLTGKILINQKSHPNIVLVLKRI